MLYSAVTKKAEQHMALRDDELIAVLDLCVVLSDLTTTTSNMSTEKNVSYSRLYVASLLILSVLVTSIQRWLGK
ncbi:hypothetical protein DPMN_185660 [Dreissena polymorpha]|uniref:Uncharacterized protein n=1 Tax=Dreissena polymorpha TaxID=45954 RepID=A0A9D4DMP0_DREPO|nr:hypothetical protein DPMN_185660 [Dreissena polymorpha]